MTHFVCDGTCGGFSSGLSTCQTESCPMHGHPLKECDCTDGLHSGILSKPQPEDKEQL